MSTYSDFFKALSEEKRLKIFLMLLNEQGGFYVCEISDALSETHCNTSRCLKELRTAGLVKRKRLGRGVLCSVVEPTEPFLKNFFTAMLSIPCDFIDENIKVIRKRREMRVGGKCIMKLSEDQYKSLKKN
jgi:DNA-binding transcriptional ArsR family regulator